MAARCDETPRPQRDRSQSTSCARVGTALLLVSLAFAVIASPAVGSLPEWGQCTAVEGQSIGRYSDAGCTERRAGGTRHDPGGYVWMPLGDGQRVNLRAASTEGGPRFETRSGASIECGALGGESFARAEGPSGAATPLWEMQGCHAGAGECHTSIAGGLGEINDFYAWLGEPPAPELPAPGWTGRLGWIDKAADPPRVGMQYTAANRERLFGLIVCEGPAGMAWIGGEPGHESSIVATVGPVDTMTAHVTETYAQSAPGVPEPARLAHHKAAVLGAFLEGRWEPVALDASFTYSVESSSGEIEIRARR